MTATPLRIVIEGGAALRGAISLPPDLPIARVALLLAALAEGESELLGSFASAELQTLIAALRAMGVAIDSNAERTRINGVGLRGLVMPTGAIDCGRSLDSLALLAGTLAGQTFGTRLTLDPRTRPRSLSHLAGALQARGVPLRATGKDAFPPIAMAPRLADEPLRAIECALPEPDSRAKNAVLLSGLSADGPTLVAEPLLSEDHLERMLSACGVALRRAASMTALAPVSALTPLGRSELPGCTTLASLIACAAAVIPGSRVAVRDVGTNPTRTGVLDALRLFGARMLIASKGERAGHEPIAELQAQHSALRGGALSGELALHCADALPLVCMLGARSLRGADLLEADSFAPAGAPAWDELATMLRAFGVSTAIAGAGIAIAPTPVLHGTQIDASGDNRLALCAVLFGLAADGETRVEHAETLTQDFPELVPLLSALGARITLEDAT